MNSDFREEFGNSVDLSDGSVDGKIIGIVAERIAAVWELSEAVYHATDPSAAEDDRLASLSALTGTLRLPASSSTATLTLTGDDTTEVGEGSRVSTLSTGVVFETAADVELAALTAWVASTAYSVGDRVSSTDAAWQCSVAGTSDTPDGPDPDGLDQGDTLADNTVTWIYLGDGLAAVDVEATSVETGPLVALSGDLTEIETPVTGWTSVINLLDATLGRNIETDEELRLRRVDELTGQGKSTVDAIRAGLIDPDITPGVTAATVFENITNVTDADGIPPGHIEALVQGGEDQDIWDTLWDFRGGDTHGTEVGTVVDSEGTEQTVKFSRPTEVEIHVEVTLTKDATTYPSDGDTQVKAAIAALGGVTGVDAVASRISAACFTVAGVIDVTEVLLDDEASPSTSTTVAISTRQIADYDSSRVDVTSSDGTP
jgi:uncharacterized phage protein gp47/JayE